MGRRFSYLHVSSIEDIIGAVKAIQVEDTLCLTGGADGSVRLWDLRIVEDYEDRLQRLSEKTMAKDPLERIAERHEEGDGDSDEDWDEGPSGFTDLTTTTTASMVEDSGPCVRVLEGHSKSVTALCYEDGCLVSCHSTKHYSATCTDLSTRSLDHLIRRFGNGTSLLVSVS